MVMEFQPEEYVPPVQHADSYNGARHENFTWSQSINDLDVLVKVPCGITNPSDLRVDVSARRIKVETRKNVLQSNDRASNVSEQKHKEYSKAFENLRNEWTSLLEGELTFPTKKDESLWFLVPGEHVNIHLEKANERWWEALIVGEEKIELSKIDCSRDLFELGDSEQMKVRELMWNHREKLVKEKKKSEF